MQKIAILGEGMIELNGKPFGTLRQTWGGDTLNTAIYLARCLDRRFAPCFVSALGEDPLSRALLEHWQTEGIDTRYILRDPVRQPGLYMILLDEQGERSFVYWRQNSAARFICRHPHYPALLDALHTLDLLYLSGISVAILPPADREKLIADLRLLKDSGVKLVFDSNYRPSLWQQPRETVQQSYHALYDLADIALLTFDDERQLWDDASPVETFHRLQEKYAIAEIVVKDGADGAWYAVPQAAPVRVAAQPVACVVDTTAAGDAFNAGFLAAYLHQLPLMDCCRQGNRLAATVIQHNGAIIPLSAMPFKFDTDRICYD